MTAEGVEGCLLSGSIHEHAVLPTCPNRYINYVHGGVKIIIFIVILHASEHVLCTNVF